MHLQEQSDWRYVLETETKHVKVSDFRTYRRNFRTYNIPVFHRNDCNHSR